MRIAAFTSHPIQYLAPLWQAMAARGDVALRSLLFQSCRRLRPPGFHDSRSRNLGVLPRFGRGAMVVDGDRRGRAGGALHRAQARPQFPHQAIEFCLRYAGLSPEQIDYVGFYDKPY